MKRNVRLCVSIVPHYGSNEVKSCDHVLVLFYLYLFMLYKVQLQPIKLMFIIDYFLHELISKMK